MQTLKFSISFDMRVVVPETVLAEARAAAAFSPIIAFADLNDSTQGNDDAFMQAVLKNAIRGGVREDVLAGLAKFGCGGTVSPVIVRPLPYIVPEGKVQRGHHAIKAESTIALEAITLAGEAE